MKTGLLTFTLIACSVLGARAIFFGEDTGNVGTQKAQQQVPLVSQSFAVKVINELNDRINGSVVASYVYLSMAFWFDRADMALPGFHKYFLTASHKARDDAEALMKYINKRGGYIKLKNIKSPQAVWRDGLKAMEYALGMEKDLNKNLLKTHGAANGDPHVTCFLEDRFLDQKVDLIKELGEYVTRLKRFTKDYHLGEYILDKDLHD
ncbi:ferritin heavy chain-like [Haliotis rubra]|uniref:ferritin heavy chain-like n=1 Tax=Haliotis rubra TaxID=36100 RepID=UPI001EE4FE34|nr:ferritin heavy chain-like [Haliotis rubra]